MAFAAGLIVAPGLAACSATGGAGPSTAAVHETMLPAMATPAAPDAREAAWAARPDYVRGDARTESAYAIAMQLPQVLEWIPCYCGCAGMGHTSNLDCYFKPTAPGLGIRFEEHASYCQICVDETLMTKQLLDQGKSLSQIRSTIDQTFGGNGPGTPTELPPA
jgi:hypothetical protein